MKNFPLLRSALTLTKRTREKYKRKTRERVGMRLPNKKENPDNFIASVASQ